MCICLCILISYICLMLLTAQSLINTVYIWIASITRDTSANGNIVDNLAIGIGTTRTRTWILTF